MNRQHLRGLALAVLFSVGLAGAGLALPRPAPPWLLVNESPSVPRGLYRRVPGRAPGLGDLVAAPQPASVRPYLAGLGVPPDLPLLKRVAAIGGEGVCARDGWLRTPRRDIATQARDRRGVVLPAWRGCRTLGADELLLLGDSPTSFDGRHFGPVRRRDVAGPYREVMRW